MEKCKRGITLCLAVLFLILLLPIPRASAATVEEQVQEKIRWIIASIPDDCDTDYEKALWLHDYLCETVTYKKGLSDYAYTALLDGVADCGGYADAYRRLLLAVGIRCGTVSGYATDEPHAWNIIWLDGKCYFSDVCWDDDPKLKFHDYFMISFEQMAEDHQANGIQDAAGEFSHPCNHNEYGNAYIGQYGNDIPKFTNNTTPEETKEYFKVTKVNGSVVTVFCDFRFDGNADNWVRSNKLPIGRMFGNSVYSRVTIGDEGYGILQYDVHDYAFTATQSISFAQATV